MNNNIKWKLTEIGPKKARIELEQFSRIPTMQEYKKYIEDLLGLDKQKNIKLIDDGYSVDLADSLLLYKELREFDNGKYEEIVFSTPEGDRIVNSENFEQVFEELNNNKKQESKETNKNSTAIKEAVEELRI